MHIYRFGPELLTSLCQCLIEISWHVSTKPWNLTKTHHPLPSSPKSPTTPAVSHLNKRKSNFPGVQVKQPGLSSSLLFLSHATVSQSGDHCSHSAGLRSPCCTAFASTVLVHGTAAASSCFLSPTGFSVTRFLPSPTGQAPLGSTLHLVVRDRFFHLLGPNSRDSPFSSELKLKPSPLPTGLMWPHSGLSLNFIARGSSLTLMQPQWLQSCKRFKCAAASGPSFFLPGVHPLWDLHGLSTSHRLLCQRHCFGEAASGGLLYSALFSPEHVPDRRHSWPSWVTDSTFASLSTCWTVWVSSKSIPRCFCGHLQTCVGQWKIPHPRHTIPADGWPLLLRTSKHFGVYRAPGFSCLFVGDSTVSKGPLALRWVQPSVLTHVVMEKIRVLDKLPQAEVQCWGLLFHVSDSTT